MPRPMVGTLDPPLLPPSSSSPFPPVSLDDLLFASSTALDTHLLTQALTRELSSCTDSPSPCLSFSSSSSSSSSKSSAELHSQFLQGMQMNGLLRHKECLSHEGSPLSNAWMCKDDADTSGISSIHKITPTKSVGNQSYERFHGNTILDSMEATQSGILHNSQASARALSSQASAGSGSTKVSKRSSRANKKPPITVLTASTSNFRAMVQQLTGIPMPTNNSSNLWSTPGARLVKPQPTRPPYSGSILNSPTLDTSASLLGRKWSHTQDFPFLQRLPQAGSHMAGKPDENANNVLNCGTMLSSSSSPLSYLWDAMDTGSHLKGEVIKQSPINGLFNESQNIMGSTRWPCASMETLLTEDHLAKVSYNSVDSWLALDGGALASPSPRVEVAKLASS